MRTRTSPRSSHKDRNPRPRRIKPRALRFEQPLVIETRTSASEQAATARAVAERPAGAYYAQRARAAGGPCDHAHYVCDCGFAFEAHVCSSVGCPACGSEQAW